MPHALIPRAHHGGKQTEQPLLDFSVNSNPLGPNPLLLEAWNNTDLTEYPEPTYLRTREILADWHGVEPDGVVLGVGASELMYRICHALLKPGDRVLSLGSPFGEFARAVQLVGATLEVTSRQEPALKPVRMLYLSNPHNPSGHLIKDLQPLLASAEVVVVDEAYLPFLGEHPVGAGSNLIRLQSPGKVHGLVGMRMAYALCPPALAVHLRNLESAWHLPGSLDQVLRVLPQAQVFLDQTLPEVRESAARLAQALQVPFQGLPYLLVPAPRTPDLHQFLLQQGLLVRDCASYGFPDHIRVSTRLDDDQKLLEGFQTFYGH